MCASRPAGTESSPADARARPGDMKLDMRGSSPREIAVWWCGKGASVRRGRFDSSVSVAIDMSSAMASNGIG